MMAHNDLEQRTNKRINLYIRKTLDTRDGRMDAWMFRWMDGWMFGWIDGWMDGWMDRLVNGWMDGFNVDTP